MPIQRTLLSGQAKTVPAAFAPTMACTVCASCVVRNVCPPTMHDIDIAICHSFQSIRRGSRTDYPCTVFAFDCTSDPCILVDSGTVVGHHRFMEMKNKCKQHKKNIKFQLNAMLLITKASNTKMMHTKYKTLKKEEKSTQTLNEVDVSSHFPKMHGSISHIVNAQNLCDNSKKKFLKPLHSDIITLYPIFYVVYFTLCFVFIFFLPSSEMSSALATVHISIRHTFSIIFARVRMTRFNLIVSRCKLILVVEI